MEDLLDDERIRQKISELEETAKKEANSVIKKQLTSVLGTSSYTKIFGTAHDGVKGTATDTAAIATAPENGAALPSPIVTNEVPTTSPLMAKKTNILENIEE